MTCASTESALDRLLAKLREKGSSEQLAAALHPRSFYTVRSWLDGTYRPGPASLRHIKQTWPELAELCQGVLDEWE